MSGRIGSPLRLAIVGTILFSGIVIGLRGSTARAENCLTEPNSAAPAGSHWYYRSDRANQRKCWYLRGVSESIEQATPETTAARAAASENRATRRPASGSSASAPLPCAVAVIRWGPDASSDKPRTGARCTSCGQKGASLQRPGWAGNHIGFCPFPVDSGPAAKDA